MSEGKGGNKALSVRWEEIGNAVDELGLIATGYRNVGVQVQGFSIRIPAVQGGDFLITVRGLLDDGTPAVAFHGSPDFGEALRGLRNRIMNGSLKWRPDQYGNR